MRHILHCDLNNFYASVECADHPELYKVPMVVGGDEHTRRGIVLAKNPLAKQYGIVTAETLYSAREKCPQLVVVPARHERYLEFSKRVCKIYSDYTDQVEPFGMDECWLDITGSTKLFGLPDQIATQIKERVKRELALSLSVGVSFNKVFAKLASDLAPNDSIYKVYPEDVTQKVWPLPASALLGVGRSTRAKLSRVGISTIGEIAGAGCDFLRHILGKNGETLWIYASGLDQSPVNLFEHRPPIKSVGNSTTCVHDLAQDEEAQRVLLSLCVKVSTRLRRHGLYAQSVVLNIRDNYFRDQEHLGHLDFPGRSAKELYACVEKLLLYHYDWHNEIRALGVRACDLLRETDAVQCNLYVDLLRRQRRERLERQADLINASFHQKLIRPASFLLPTLAPE